MTDRAIVFRDLHRGPRLLRLVNAWDALSARVAALAGAPAIGTSSFAVAAARGFPDGQRMSARAVIDAAAEIVAAVDVPVTVDIEAGYGPSAADVDRMVAGVVAAGAVGINLEDGRPDQPGALFEIADQCGRIEAARSRAAAEGVDVFVNARCDVYFGAAVPPEQRRSAALDRTRRYRDAGADGVFLPGLTDLDVVAEVASTVQIPLNVMLWPHLPAVAELEQAGVRRLSQGGAAFFHAVGYLERMTGAYLTGEPIALGGDVPPALHLLAQLAYR
jgi:2-methylisocitrate lyase-like PEP mutase family enzyme